jgi:excisionase family DNA binding protein
MSIEPDTAPELLTVAEAAEILTISIPSVRHLQQQRRIPFYKVGGSLRFARSDILAYLHKRRIQPIDTYH